MTTKLNCWEFKKCGREIGGTKVDELGACPAAKNASGDGLNEGRNGGRICWAITGTLCSGEVQGTFAQKELACMTCDFFQIVKEERKDDFHLLTPEQRMEEVLRKGEDRYRTLFDGVPIGLYRTTPTGQFLDANEAMAQVLGYPGREELLCVNAADLYVDPEDRVRWKTLIEQKGVMRGFETRMRRHDGATFWVSITARAVQDETGRPLYYEGAVEDITERKQAEEKLKKSEEHFRSLIENSSDIITVYGADGIIRFQSPSLERFMGYKPEETIGKKRGAVIAIHPDDLALAIDAAESAIQNPGVTFGPIEVRIRHKDGTWRWSEAAYKAMVEKSGQIFVVINSRDVTKRKQVIEALHEGEEKYRGIFENSVVGIFQSTTKGRFITVNQALARIHGFASPEEMMAEITDVGSQLYVNQEDRQRYLELLRKDGMVKSLEIEQYRKDKSKIWVSISSKAIRDTNGNVLYYQGIVEDITSRKQAEEERKKMEEDLRQSEERFRLLAENTSDMILTIDLSTDRYTYVSPSVKRLRGYTVEEALQQNIEESLTPASLAVVREHVKKSVRQAAAGRHMNIEHLELEHTCKDGSTIWVEGALNLIYNTSGNVVGIQGVSRDISERKKADAALKQYQDFLENLSTTDGLTGISNRRRFDEFLDREWARAKRSQTPLSLILMDIDFFKAFNDHYGHLAGDDCLRQLAQCLTECVRRPVDLAARYGGEEFVCLLPDADADGAMLVAHQIQEKMNSLSIPHAYSSVADHVTLSMGVATLIPEIGQSPSDLIQRADELLYAAKRDGRNQVRS